jgi:7-carboxy-7-deazaguanine synthase
MLQVKEIFGPTIQGEGAQAGWPAIFVRFAGCNMWNGAAETKAKSMCPYCDTDFVGGKEMTVDEVVRAVHDLIPEHLRNGKGSYLVVLTGGEPLLQPPADLTELSRTLQQMGHKTQIETNGATYNEAVQSINFVTVSPKVPMKRIKIPWFHVDTLKLLHPHPTVNYREFVDLITEAQRPRWFYIQPIDAGDPIISASNLAMAVNAVKELGYPWRLSLQTHKLINEQ